MKIYIPMPNYEHRHCPTNQVAHSCYNWLKHEITFLLNEYENGYSEKQFYGHIEDGNVFHPFQCLKHPIRKHCMANDYQKRGEKQFLHLKEFGNKEYKRNQYCQGNESQKEPRPHHIGIYVRHSSSVIPTPGDIPHRRENKSVVHHCLEIAHNRRCESNLSEFIHPKHMSEVRNGKQREDVACNLKETEGKEVGYKRAEVSVVFIII